MSISYSIYIVDDEKTITDAVEMALEDDYQIKAFSEAETAIKQLEDQLEIGRTCVHEGKPELIAEKIVEYVMPELDKLRKVRGEEVYSYAAFEHIPFQSKIYAEFCEKRFKE